VSKLSDAETEAEETRVWLEFALRCDDSTANEAKARDECYDRILAQLVRMISEPKKWAIH
jgi:hypothetical protein